jgi:plastocyanin
VKQILIAAARLGVVLGLAAAVVGGAACSSDDGDKGAKSSSSSSASGTVDPSGNITIVGKDNVYEPKQFTGPANQKITVKLDNQGAAIHNFAVKGQKGPDGNDIGALALVNAKQTGTVEFTLPAGSYEFYCTVHPVEMTGKLTLQ